MPQSTHHIWSYVVAVYSPSQLEMMRRRYARREPEVTWSGASLQCPRCDRRFVCYLKTLCCCWTNLINLSLCVFPFFVCATIAQLFSEILTRATHEDLWPRQTIRVRLLLENVCLLIGRHTAHKNVAQGWRRVMRWCRLYTICSNNMIKINAND